MPADKPNSAAWAETTALDALGFVVSRDDLLEIFLASTGYPAESLRAGAHDPELLAAIVDFLAMDDSWVLAFAAASDRDPMDLIKARQALPGGETPSWT